MYLNCHTYYSFKYGTLSVTQLLTQAQQLKVDALVLTDINNTSGCLEFIRESKKYGVRPIIGIDFRTGSKQHYIGIAKNNEGFLELNQHLSAYLSEQLAFSTQAPMFYNSYVIYPYGSMHPKQLREHEYIGVKIHELNKLIFSECRSHLHKLVVLHPVTFLNKKDFNAHRLLRAIDNNTLLSKLPVSEQTNENELFYEEVKLLQLYEDYPQLVINTRRITDACSIQFEFGTSKNKSTFTGSIVEDQELMRKECFEGLLYRYNNPDQTIRDRLEKELQAIFSMHFTSYFLINWDMLKYARNKGYFYVGRGSGANSLAAYCLKITDVDPIDLDLYFERFINPYRINPPDFDIDFSWKDRDDITRYLFEKYGTAHTALLATYNTFQYNSVIRELGKVFGLPKGEIDELVETKRAKQTPDSITHLIFKYSAYIQDFPSHLSIHAGGILISEKPLNYYTATSMPPKGYPLTQFSMIESEGIGLYKFDILSQRGLGHIKDTIEVVKKNRGIDIDIHQIAAFKEDEKIKSLLRSGKTMGCFYVESPAMRMLLKKLETDSYLGLVAASSIIRPGVAQSGMMREYILRHRDPKRRNYIHPKMEELMKETYGIMVYQEDVIKVAHSFAGLSLAQADVMRRGMSGKFRSREEFQKAKEDFFKNCKNFGYTDELTKEVWRQIESFAGYSFSKGHSASYAVESYQSLYLKAYYPKEFMVGVINNFGGFYRTENYIHEAKMSGANILAPCINNSEHLTSIQHDDIYLGFIHLGELEKNTIELMLMERGRNGLFLDLEDFMKRVNISVEQLRILIRMGAFRFTGKTKKELLWEIHGVLGSQKKTNPAHELFEVKKRDYKLPELHHNVYDDALDEIEILGFPLCSPFALLKEKPTTDLNVQQLLEQVGKYINIVGCYVVHKVTRTIKGDNMA
ncbi:MAG TPA: DNA polymerase III subunit alpha, partial [Bacteroidia bacterium]|nr:DNA polymerase III subunit alpha [Bacteroidia bacterium]